MRPLTEDEMRQVFEKLHKFIGKNIKSLIERQDEPHCLRLQKNRVFYVREDLMKRATNVSILAFSQATLSTTPLFATSNVSHLILLLQVARDKLVALGTCIGKFTHTGKFRLTIGCLDILAQYAKYKVRLCS